MEVIGKITVDRLKNLPKKSFLRDAFIMQIGTFFSTGMAVLASILYARILGVHGYANYALIFAFAGIVSTFMNVGSDQTVLTLMSAAYARKDKQEITDLLSYYLVITSIFAVVIGVVALLFAPLITTKLYSNANIGNMARMIIVANIVQIVWSMYVLILQIIRKIKKLTWLENINKIFMSAVPLVFVLTGFGLSGLVFGYFMVCLIFAIYALIRYNNLCFENQLLPSWQEIISNISQVASKKYTYYFKYGFLIAVDKNIGSLYSTIPFFILGTYSLEAVAFVKIAIAYAQIPSIVLSPISRLLMVKLPQSKVISLKILRRDYLRSISGSLVITVPLAILLYLIAPIFIPLFYGNKFMPAVGLTFPFLLAAIITGMGIADGGVYRILNLMKQSIIINTILIFTGTLALLQFLYSNYFTATIWLVALWLPAATIVSIIYALIKLAPKQNAN
ncbi:MAG: oligosaccharide flippase family protein [Candidatus Falkowbacteria bacterium]|nr:oligosaccharide flippase family protein [Candidatus Falkowbacteria bacterium]